MTKPLAAGLAVVAALAVASPRIVAQTPAAPPAANPITDSIKAQYNIVKGYVTKAAAMLEEKDYTFKPAGVAAEVRTFGQLVGHIANAQFMLCGGASGERAQSPGNIERMTSKAEIEKGLAASFAACDKAFTIVNDRTAAETVTGLPIGPTTRLGALSFNVAHDFEHYGNLVTYLRAKGLVPPSSQR